MLTVVRIIIRWCQEAIPSAWREKGIVQHHRCVASFSSLGESIAIELLDLLKLKCRAEWFVKQLDGYNHVLVLLLCILLGDSLENVQGLLD